VEGKSVFAQIFWRVGVLVVALLSGWPVLAADGVLKVGVTADYEPLVFIRDDKLVGIEVDNAREVGQILGRPVETVQMSFNQLLPALKSGTVDVIMSGFTVTPERAEQVAFANPFMEVGQMAIISLDRAGRFAQPRALERADIRICVEPGTTGDAYVRDNLPNAVLRHCANSAVAFAQLRAGDVDVYIHDAPTSWKLAGSRDDQDMLGLFRPLTSERLAWAVRSDDTRLLGELNLALAKLKANGRLSAIQNFWIPVRVSVR
jgi:ABC-type amino acid transport substrate-binding protein